MKKTLVFLTALTLFGCAGNKPKPDCDQLQSVALPVAAFLASPAALDCTNQDAIMADLEGFLGTMGICQKITPPPAKPGQVGGPIGNIICVPLVAWATSKLVNNSDTLRRWGCKGTGVEAAFALACQYIPI